MLIFFDGLLIKLYTYSMRKCIFLILSILLTSHIFGQKEEVDQIIDQGVALHEYGLYDDALRKYTQALAADKKNLRAKYEMAYAYLALKKWDEAIYYSYEVVDEEGEYYLDACMLYGAALNKSGRAKQSVRFFRKIIKEYPEEYLLYYNLAISHYTAGEIDEAQKNVQEAIRINKTHMDSHFLLSGIMQDKGERLKGMLPLYYLLLYEQDSPRSVEAYERLQLIWRSAAVMRKKEVSLPISSLSSSSAVMAIEIGVGAIASTYMIDEAKNKLEEPYKLAGQTQELLDLMDELQSGELDFFDIYYIDFFNLLTRNQHAEVFSYYISNCVHKDKVLLWITENNSPFASFMDWMELQE